MRRPRASRAARVLAFLLLLIPVHPASALAAEWGELRAATGRVNLRAGRGTDTPVLAQLEEGQVVRVALEKDGWVAVFPAYEDSPTADPKQALGYALGRLLEPTETAPPPPPRPPGPEEERREEVLRPATNAPDPSDSVEDPSPVATRREVLFGIARAIEQHERELTRARAALSDETDSRSMEAKLAAVREHEQLIETLRKRFAATAAGINLDPLGDGAGADFEWSDELKELLSPVLQELKRATIRPRELDRLSREKARYEEHLRSLQLAFEGAEELRAQMESEVVARELQALVDDWEADRERAEAELAFVEQRLEQLRGERTSLAASVRDLSQLFFRSRGRNLLLALGALVATMLGLRFVHSKIKQLSPLHKGERGSAVRVFDLAFVAGEIVAASLVFLAVLYLTGDWVLLTIASVFLFGVAWASKTAIPRFWQQTMLLLNLGPVRERERLVYNGIPWKVGAIGVYTQLTNPALEGGTLRLPIRDLSEVHSRPFGPSEPWFPTRKGDWVLVGDVHGRVVVQTPEVVTLVRLGGARVSYRSEDFLGMGPLVLSTGFRLRSIFGIDYQHQAIATDEVPAGLKAHVLEGLRALNVSDQIVKLTVELGAAGASSLDIEVIVDLKGDVAPRYRELERALQRLCVEACNANGWVIPFTQITLHTAHPAAPIDATPIDAGPGEEPAT